MEPMDGDSRALLTGFVAFFLLVGVLGWRGCANDERTSMARAQVQAECLRSGHAALECKELR